MKYGRSLGHVSTACTFHLCSSLYCLARMNRLGPVRGILSSNVNIVSCRTERAYHSLVGVFRGNGIASLLEPL